MSQGIGIDDVYAHGWDNALLRTIMVKPFGSRSLLQLCVCTLGLERLFTAQSRAQHSCVACSKATKETYGWNDCGHF